MKLIAINTARYTRGFTLIELIITILVVSILMTIAIPSFQNTIQQNRFSTQSNELIGALNLARSEAIRRGESVTVTPNGGSWTNGWVVATTAPVTTLRSFPALATNFTYAGGPTSYTYLPSGFKDNTNVDLYSLCNSSVTGETGRQVRISASGRPRIVLNVDGTYFNPC